MNKGKVIALKKYEFNNQGRKNQLGYHKEKCGSRKEREAGVYNVMSLRYNKLGGVLMANANINVRTDAAIKAQAQQIFESIGLDLSTAVNLFLKQTVKSNNLPFPIGISYAHPAETATEKRVSRRGVWKGKYSLPKDFDAPLDDFKEYM